MKTRMILICFSWIPLKKELSLPLGPPASSETCEFVNGMKQLRMGEKIAILKPYRTSVTQSKENPEELAISADV
ncbi:unnamed protein product [Prunus brigantina]